MGCRTGVFGVAAVLLLCTAAYAGQLVSEEAGNYFREGVEAQKKDKLSTVIMAYQKTMLVSPKNSVYEKYIANNLGIMYANQGDLDRAEVLFKEALKIDPGYKPAQYNLGLIFDKKPDELKALKYWLMILKIDVNSMKPKGFTMEGTGTSEKKE